MSLASLLFISTLFIFYSWSIYLFGVLCCFQHCTGHITMGSWKGRGNQYIQFVRILYCKLPTNGKQLPSFPLEAVLGTEPRPQRWEATVLPLCHCGPHNPGQSLFEDSNWPWCPGTDSCSMWKNQTLKSGLRVCNVSLCQTGELCV